MVRKVKFSLWAILLITAECVSIIIGMLKIVCQVKGVKFDSKAIITELTKDKRLEEGEFVLVEHNTYTGVLVPDLTGRNYYEVAKELDELGGWLRKEGYDYSNEYPKDAIISQRVKPGEEIIYGSTLYVRLSLGPVIDMRLNDDSDRIDSIDKESFTDVKENDYEERVTVPNLIGLSLGEAGNLLLKVGLDMGLPTYDVSDIYPKDVVIRQSKESGAQAGKGEIIYVTLNRGTKQSDDTESAVNKEDDFIEDEIGSADDIENNSLVDASLLCQLASDYYYYLNGIRPPCVRVDSYDGDIVNIHLYEALADHDATWDWYFVNRVTGETQNIMGDSFNLFENMAGY